MLKGIGIFALAALGWLMGIQVAAGEEVYVRVDEEGVAHFTNAPTRREFRPVSPEDLPARPFLSSPNQYTSLIQAAADEHEVDPALVHAMIRAESNFDPYAVSRKGARGLMQLMPQTAWELSVHDAFDPKANIAGGVQHLKKLLDRFEGNVGLALAAYNAGENAVLRYGGVPPYRETKDYVAKVLSLYQGKASTSNGRPAPKASPAIPPLKVYRYVDETGAVRYTNVPPLLPRRETGPPSLRAEPQDEADGR